MKRENSRAFCAHFPRMCLLTVNPEYVHLFLQVRELCICSRKDARYRVRASRAPHFFILKGETVELHLTKEARRFYASQHISPSYLTPLLTFALLLLLVGIRNDGYVCVGC